MPWGEIALWWLPTALLLAMTAVALFAIAAQTDRPARRTWMAATLAGGAVALMLSAWQQAQGRAALEHEAGDLREVGSRLDALGRSLPAGTGTGPSDTFDSVAAALSSLNAKIKDLESQVAALQEKSRNRTIAPDMAVQMADYLKQFGSQRVVVSCLPEDVEGYAYANQIANILRAGGWDAHGPETTTIFGANASAMEVVVYVRSGMAPPDSANVLLDAFKRFNIPYRSGITPSDALPDPATVELFVARKP